MNGSGQGSDGPMPRSYGDKLMCSFDYSSNTSATSACALRAPTTRAMRSSDATSLLHTKATYTNISKTLILFPPTTADQVLCADLWMKLICLPLLLLPGTTHLSHRLPNGFQEIRGVRITHTIKKKLKPILTLIRRPSLLHLGLKSTINTFMITI